MANSKISANYESQLVRLSDLTVVKDIIEKQVFHNCQIVGPAIVVSQNSVFNGCNFDVGGGSLDSILFPITGRNHIVGVIGLVNCEFYECQFTRVGLMGAPEEMDAVRAALSGGQS